MSEDADFNAYEEYANDPEVRRRREEIRQAFLDAAGLRKVYQDMQAREEGSLPEGWHGRWGIFSLDDLKFLHGVHIAID